MVEENKGKMKVCLELTAYDEHGNVTGRYKNPDDLITKQFAQFTQSNLFATAESITDNTNTSRSIAANTATGTVYITAGTGTTAAAVTDYAMEAQSAGTSGYAAATVNAYSGSGTSGSYTITASITNSSGSTIDYTEAGITIISSTYTFLMLHDVFTALPVSNNGILSATYTITLS